METAGNQLGAIADYSELGNSHYDPQSSGDNNPALGEGTPDGIATISPVFSVCTLSGTAATLRNNVGVVGTWVTICGSNGAPDCSGPADGTFRVTGVLPLPPSPPAEILYTCNLTTSYTGGQVRTASSTEVYAAYPVLPAFPNGSDETGLLTGPFVAPTTSGFTSWLNPYCESGTETAPFFGGGSTLVIGARCPISPTPFPAEGWQQFYNGHLLGGTGLVFDSRSAAPEVVSQVGGPPASLTTMTDQTWHEEHQLRGPDNYSNSGMTGYNSGALWFDIFHGCSEDTITYPYCSPAAPIHHFWLEQYLPAGNLENNPLTVTEAGDITTSPPPDDATPMVNTLTLGSAGASGGTIVQANLTGNENLFLPGLLPPAGLSASPPPNPTTSYTYYIWANYQNGASGIYSQPISALGLTPCPQITLHWLAVYNATSYTIFRQGAGIIATVPASPYTDPPSAGASCDGDTSNLPPYAPNEGVAQEASLWLANYNYGMGGPHNAGWTVGSVVGTAGGSGCGVSANDMYFAPGERTGECPPDSAPLILGSNNTATINNLVVTTSCTYLSGATGCGGGSSGFITVNAILPNGNPGGSVGDVNTVTFNPAQAVPNGTNSALVTIVAAGDTNYVQYNAGGLPNIVGANPGFQFDPATESVSIGGSLILNNAAAISSLYNIETRFLSLRDNTDATDDSEELITLTSSEAAPRGIQAGASCGESGVFVIDDQGTPYVGGAYFCSCSGPSCQWAKVLPALKGTTSSFTYPSSGCVSLPPVSIVGVLPGQTCTAAPSTGNLPGPYVAYAWGSGSGQATVEVCALGVGSGGADMFNIICQ